MNAHPDLEHNYWDRVFFDCSDTGIGVPNVKYLSSSVMGEGPGVGVSADAIWKGEKL